DIANASDGRRVEASLDTDELSVAKLLAPLLDQRLAITGAAEAAIAGKPSIWPDEPFRSDAFDAFKGKIHIATKRLLLAEGIALEGAKVAIALDTGKMEIEQIVGKGLGGEFNARLRLTKAAVGAELQGTLSFGAALEAFTSSNPPRASGPVNGTLEFR